MGWLGPMIAVELWLGGVTAALMIAMCRLSDIEAALEDDE